MNDEKKSTKADELLHLSIFEDDDIIVDMDDCPKNDVDDRKEEPAE